ncbi:MAG: hypothetical protein PHD88_10095 [Firmicutes bacterium]|nr:hypothetical protein [Bacillota bacterium]MDD4694713.1 hypothetical protein [Bacillota bacterium]
MIAKERKKVVTILKVLAAAIVVMGLIISWSDGANIMTQGGRWSFDIAVSNGEEWMEFLGLVFRGLGAYFAYGIIIYGIAVLIDSLIDIYSILVDQKSKLNKEDNPDSPSKLSETLQQV